MLALFIILGIIHTIGFIVYFVFGALNLFSDYEEDRRLGYRMLKASLFWELHMISGIRKNMADVADGIAEEEALMFAKLKQKQADIEYKEKMRRQKQERRQRTQEEINRRALEREMEDDDDE